MYGTAIYYKTGFFACPKNSRKKVRRSAQQLKKDSKKRAKKENEAIPGKTGNFPFQEKACF